MNQFDDLFKHKIDEEHTFSGQNRSWETLDRNLQAFEAGAATSAKALMIWKAIALVAGFSAILLLVELNQLVSQLKNLQQSAEGVQTLEASHLPTAETGALPTLSPRQSAYPTLSSGSMESRRTRIDHSTSVDTDSEILLAAQKKGSEPMRSTMDQNVEAILPRNHTLGKTDVAQTDSIELKTFAQTPLPIDSLQSKEDIIMPEPLPPIIDPVAGVNGKWRAGVRLLVGTTMPKEMGVSSLTGKGIGITRRIWKGISMTASADFFRFEVDAETIPAHFAAFDPPPLSPGQHFHDLKNVSSSMALQQYSLGIGYTIPIVRHLGVSLNIAHAWAYSPSKVAYFRFEDMGHGGPGPYHPEEEFAVAKTRGVWQSNIWKLGIGLQYDWQRWSIGMQGDYAIQGKASESSFSALYTNASLQYKF